jgi:hypothetical protein
MSGMPSQDIEIINAFHDEVSDIKIVEEIGMKKPEMVVDLLAVADVCIEGSKARAWLLNSRNKEPPKKKKQEDQEVNIVHRGNHKKEPT